MSGAWSDAPLDEVIAESGSELIVKFEAAWCGACGQLDRLILSGAAGREVIGDRRAVRVDFEEERNADVSRRFAILDLPTVIFLYADGSERARVVGFYDVDAWVGRATRASQEEDVVGRLAAEFDREPDRAEVGVELAEQLLARDPSRALELLERLSFRPDGAGANALFLLGRYHQRVLGDAQAGLGIWRELATRYPESSHARGAFWWYAMAQVELGRTDLGSDFLGARVRLYDGGPAAVLEWARFVGREAHEPSRLAVREAVLAAIGAARGPQRDQLETLAMELGRKLA